jgi:hypothetical protein
MVKVLGELVTPTRPNGDATREDVQPEMVGLLRPLKDDSVALSRKASINERIFDVESVRA